MDNEKIETIRKKYGVPEHYHGDLVRKLFVLAAIIMIVTLPALNSRLPVSPIVSIGAIIVVSLSAGFLEPRKKWAIVLDLLISIFATLTFEYYAVETYRAYSSLDTLFLANQALAVIFLFALYNSAKTFRAVFV